MKKLSLFIITVFAIISCKEDEDIVGNVNLDFSNTINDQTIVLSTESYTNQSNETYTISEIKYIISNIVFIKENGDEFKYPTSESFFVINEEVSESKSLNLTNILSGKYTKIKFGIGVDQSNYPLEGANFVPTAQENDMIWSWSSGYKFIKFEGSFTTPELTTPEEFLLHIGSHGEALDNYEEAIIDLSDTLVVENNSSSIISIKADIAKIFDSINTHSLVIKKDVQIDPFNAPLLAENVSTMFSVTNVSNQ